MRIPRATHHSPPPSDFPCPPPHPSPPPQASHCSGRVWPAAIVLKQYLDSEACISLSDDDAILELGAGTGWLALKMASR